MVRPLGDRLVCCFRERFKAEVNPVVKDVEIWQQASSSSEKSLNPRKHHAALFHLHVEPPEHRTRSSNHQHTTRLRHLLVCVCVGVHVGTVSGGGEHIFT